MAAAGRGSTAVRRPAARWAAPGRTGPRWRCAAAPARLALGRAGAPRRTQPQHCCCPGGGPPKNAHGCCTKAPELHGAASYVLLNAKRHTEQGREEGKWKRALAEHARAGSGILRTRSARWIRAHKAGRAVKKEQGWELSREVTRRACKGRDLTRFEGKII